MRSNPSISLVDRFDELDEGGGSGGILLVRARIPCRQNALQQSRRWENFNGPIHAAPVPDRAATFTAGRMPAAHH